MESRSMANGGLLEVNDCANLKATFINDGAKAWKTIPANIKNCESLYMAKKEIKKFVKTLPL